MFLQQISLPVLSLEDLSFSYVDKAIADVTGTFDGVEEISAELREGIVNYIQRTLHERRDIMILAVLPTGQIENHCRSSYTTWHMWSAAKTRHLPRAKMMLVPMNFFSCGQIMTELMCIIFVACFILRGRDRH